MEAAPWSVVKNPTTQVTCHAKTRRISKSASSLQWNAPSQLDRGVPDDNDIALSKTKPDDLLIAAEAELKNVSAGLNSFLLKPAGLVGADLFAHLI